MPVNISQESENLTVQLKRFTSMVSRVTFVGQHIIIFLKDVPKRNAEHIRSAIADYLSEQYAVEYSFFRQTGKKWVFRKAV